MGRLMPAGWGAAGGSAGVGSWISGSSTGESAINPRAVWRTACAAGSEGSTSTSGTPLSDCSRSGRVSGTLPSSGTSSSSASAWPPPSPKMAKRSPDGVTKPAMFSTTPAISSETLCAISAARRALGTEPVHAGDRVPPHVGVQDPHALSFGGERRRQVGGQRGLAHPALARAHAQDVGHLGQRALGQPAAAQALGQRRLLVGIEDVEVDLDGAHAGNPLDRFGDRGLEVVADGTAGGGQRHGDVDGAALADVDRAHHVQLDDRAAQLGIDHRLKLVADLLLGHASILADVALGLALAGPPEIITPSPAPRPKPSPHPAVSPASICASARAAPR